MLVERVTREETNKSLKEMVGKKTSRSMEKREEIGRRIRERFLSATIRSLPGFVRKGN